MHRRGWLLGAVAVCAAGAAVSSVVRWQIARLEQIDTSMRGLALAAPPPPPIDLLPVEVVPPPAPATLPAFVAVAESVPATLPTTVAEAAEKTPAADAAAQAAVDPGLTDDAMPLPPPPPVVAARPPRDVLTDPRSPLDERRRAVSKLAHSEEGGALLLTLTEEGRLSAELRELAVTSLLQNAATLAGAH